MQANPPIMVIIHHLFTKFHMKFIELNMDLTGQSTCWVGGLRGGWGVLVLILIRFSLSGKVPRHERLSGQKVCRGVQ